MCGIADEPFWPFAELLLHLAHLGAREVPELDRDLVEHRRHQRQRVHEGGVAIALHDLGRGRLEADAEPRADRLFHGGIEVGEGADGAGDLADGRLVDGPREPLARAVAAHSCRTSSFSPKVVGSAWIAVGATDARRVLVLERARGAAPASARSQPASSRSPGVADLQRERGVDHVARRHPEVDEARVGADVLGDVGQERDHVVAHLALDLGDARRRRSRRARGSSRAAPRGSRRARQHFADGESRRAASAR